MDLATKAYFGLLLVTIIAYILALRKNEPHAGYIVALLVLWFVVSATAISLVNYGVVKNNLFIFHIMTPLEYLILGLLYRNMFANKTIKKLIAISLPVFVALCIIFSIFIQTIVNYNAYVQIIESILLVFVTLFYLREILLLQQVTVLHKFPMFWISVGLLFYYTCSLISISAMNYLIKNYPELADRTYNIGIILKYSLVILLLTGALCNFKNDLFFKRKESVNSPDHE